MNNQEILEKINGVLKSIMTNDLGKAKLAPSKQQQFVRVVSEATPLLDAARRIDMTSHTHDIDRVGFAGRILRSAQEGVEGEHSANPDFHTNQLESVEVMAIAGITDSTLEDNIEREGFENTLLDLIADRVGIDLEELFINGDKSSNDPVLKLTDGWLKKAANEVTDVDFDTNDVEDMFDAMIKAVPKKYLRNRNEWAFYVHWDIEDTYRNVLRKRGTGLGDQAQTTSQPLSYKGIRIQDVSNMPEGTALLVPQSNLVYGIYRDISIEPDRIPKARRTDFVATLRVDCHYEDENAAVVGKGFQLASLE